MTISIGTIHYPQEVFHLLDLAVLVIQKCQLEPNGKKASKKYSFNLDLDFELIGKTIDFNNLKISGDGFIYLVEESGAIENIDINEEFSIDDVSIPFTIPNYLCLLDDRIRYSLGAISLEYVSSTILDSSIEIVFTVGANSIEEYKAQLIANIQKSLSFKIYGDIQQIESAMIAKIRSIDLDMKTTNLFLDKADFGRSFDDLEHPILPIHKEDSVVICNINYPKEPFELMLYILLIKGYLLSVSKYRGKFKIDIYLDMLEQDEPIIRPIKFYKETGDVYLNGDFVGNIKYKSVLYKFFLILYKNQNTFISADDLADELKLHKHARMPYEILNGYKFDLKDTDRLGEAFVNAYIITENKEFKLKNI